VRVVPIEINERRLTAFMTPILIAPESNV
jgi:hypothetical protein